MNGQVSVCIQQIKRLGFKPGTQLNIFCPQCSGSIKTFSDKPDETEIQKFLDSHRGRDCFFGFSDGRRWKIQGDGGIESDRPQKIESTIETVIPEEPLSKSNPEPDKGKDAISDNLIKGASPQIEDGHTDIANEIAEALAKIRLSSYESCIVWVVFRKTYGWHKKTDQISITQFEKATGIKRWHVARTLAELVERKIVTRIGNSRIITYGFQKDYTKWRDITKRGNDVAISSLSGEGKRKIVTRIGNRSLPKGVTTKETNKRNLFVEGSNELRLASFLLEEILKNKPTFKQPNLQSWAKDIDLMIRRDSRTPERIEKVILWCQHHSFWWKNILSTEKLRDQFERLEAEMASPQKGKEPERSKEKPRILTAED